MLEGFRTRYDHPVTDVPTSSTEGHRRRSNLPAGAAPGAGLSRGDPRLSRLSVRRLGVVTRHLGSCAWGLVSIV